ncbi:MAG TPA: dihydrolipoamide acetyltransferase family protein [Cyclobacteriaceae bacterium]
MASVEMVMPKMGESIMEGTILTWLKKEGDTIEQDESVLEVATDKVDTEVPSTHGGTLKKILANEGEVVEVGHPIAVIETTVEESHGTDQLVTPEAEAAQHAEAMFTEAIKQYSNSEVTKEPSIKRFYSPLVMNIAKTEGVSTEELEKIPGTGKDSRVTKRDILAFLDRKKKSHEIDESQEVDLSQDTTPINGQSKDKPDQYFDGQDEIIEMDRMRKMISERMVSSKRTAPHVTSFVEADVTKIAQWRNKMKKTFKEREGQSLTFTPIFIEAVAKAIKDYPMINIQLDGDKIVKKGSINIGMAVALPSGNLIVPVIHQADQLNLIGLTKKVNDLATRARNNQLKPDELGGGTYTMSNVGSFGNVMGTPIIMQPQVAIMAFGAVVKKPAVIETPQGDFIGIRQKMFLSHSYDHRVVDGALGGMFVRRVADYLESFDINRVV